METRWMYRTSADLADPRDAAKGVCVIPMGCVEKLLSRLDEMQKGW